MICKHTTLDIIQSNSSPVVYVCSKCGAQFVIRFTEVMDNNDTQVAHCVVRADDEYARLLAFADYLEKYTDQLEKDQAEKLLDIATKLETLRQDVENHWHTGENGRTYHSGRYE